MLYKYSLLLSLICLITAKPWCQERSINKAEDLYRRAEKLYSSGDATDQSDSVALTYYRYVIDNIPVDNKNGQLIHFDAFMKAGRLAHSYLPLKEAITLYSGALVSSELYGLNDSTRFHPNLLIGMAYYVLQEIDSSIIYLERAEAISTEYPNISEQDRLFNSLGVLYYESGNYGQSINYFQKAIGITPNIDGYYEYQTSAYRSNIAAALRRLGQYDSAIVIYRKIISDDLNQDYIPINLGISYNQMNKPDSAIYFFNQLSISDLNQSNVALPAFYNNIAEAYVLKGELNRAVAYLDTARLLSKGNDGLNTFLSRSNKLLGDIASLKELPFDALHYYQLALNELVLEFNDTSIYTNPKTEFTISSYDLFETLAAKAAVFDKEYRKTQELNMLQGAIDSYEAAIHVSDYIAKYFDNDNARIFHTSLALPIYENAVDLLVYTYERTGNNKYLEKAFLWSEKSKANTLSISLKEGNLRSKKHLPDSLIKMEDNLKFRLSQLTLRLESVKDTTELNQLKNDLINTKVSLSRLRARFHDYPEYYALKFAYDSLYLEELQSSILQKGQALLSYFCYQNSLLLFIVTKNGLKYVNINFSDQEKASLAEYIKGLQTIQPGKPYAGHQLSKTLFDLLIEPIFDHLTRIHSLIIIPHHQLNNLPFETLQFYENEYLVELFDISYQYAASFISDDKEFKVKLSESLGVAPFSTGTELKSQKYTLLPSSALEIESLNGISLLGKEATKENILRDIQGVKLLHLATHAYADNTSPSKSHITLYPGSTEGSDYKLFTSELSNLDLDALELVFLSACETAAGKLVHGEGIMSISRSFTSAGCKNIITSLWKAEDRATAFISKRFYHHLEKGHSPAKALQQSKIDLLSDKDYSQFKTPNYWSHLIYIGDSQASNVQNYYWIYILTVVIALFLIYYIKTTKQTLS